MSLEAALTMAALEAGIQGLRINPGNIGSKERVAAVEFLRRQCYYTTGKLAMPRLVKDLKLVARRA